MANCIHCGRPAGLLRNVHLDCQRKADGYPQVTQTARRDESSAAAPPPAAAHGTVETSGSPVLCSLVGVVFLFTGLYFLVFAPGLPSADALVDSVAGIRVVNFQRLAMGQAFTVAGAVFLAAAWRPRR